MATPAYEVRPRQQNYTRVEYNTGRRCDLDYKILPTLILTTTISPTHNNEEDRDTSRTCIETTTEGPE